MSTSNGFVTIIDIAIDNSIALYFLSLSPFGITVGGMNSFYLNNDDTKYSPYSSVLYVILWVKKNNVSLTIAGNTQSLYFIN